VDPPPKRKRRPKQDAHDNPPPQTHQPMVHQGLKAAVVKKNKVRKITWLP
jgi:hypothetical protein